MTRSRRTALRQTPTSFNTMTVSDFVRGGLYDLKEPTVIVTHGEPLGIWTPRDKYEAAFIYETPTIGGVSAHINTNATADSGALSTTLFSATGSVGQYSPLGASPPHPPVDVVALNKAVEKLHEYLAVLNPSDEQEEEKKNG